MGLVAPPQYFPKNAVMNKTGYQSMDVTMKKGLHPLSLFLLLMLPPMKLYIPVKGGHPFRFKGGQLGLLFFEGFVTKFN